MSYVYSVIYVFKFNPIRIIVREIFILVWSKIAPNPNYDVVLILFKNRSKERLSLFIPFGNINITIFLCSQKTAQTT